MRRVCTAGSKMLPVPHIYPNRRAMASRVLTEVPTLIFEYLTPNVDSETLRVLCYTQGEFSRENQRMFFLSGETFKVSAGYAAVLGEFDAIVTALRSVSLACTATSRAAPAAACDAMCDHILTALSFALVQDERMGLLDLLMQPKGRIVAAALRSVERVDRYGAMGKPRATSLLHFAALSGNMRLLRMIIAASAGVPPKPVKIRHLYCEGSWEYDPASPLDGLDEYMATPLMVAAEKKNSEAVTLLLAARASVEGFGGERAYGALQTSCSDCINPFTPLQVACIQRDHATAVALIEASADVNPMRFDAHEESPLADLIHPNLNALTPEVSDSISLLLRHRRECRSCLFLARALLEARADADGLAAPGAEGLFHRSPLFLAVEYCHVEMAELLLEFKADPLLRDSYGDAAVDVIGLSSSIDRPRMHSLLLGRTRGTPDVVALGRGPHRRWSAKT